MPRVKLASEKVDYRGFGSSGVQPTRLSVPGQLQAPGAGAAIRAPQVNVNAGNVRFTPLPVPEIQVTDEWQQAAQFSQHLLNETFKFQEKQNQIDSDLLVLQYEQQQSDRWNGFTDKDGEWVEGMSTKKGKQFTDNHQDFVVGADQDFHNLLMNASEGVRQKAFLRMHDTRNTYLGRAAQKKAQEVEYAYEQGLLVQHEQIYKEIEIDPDRGWAQLKTLAGNPHWSQQEKVEMMAKGGRYTVEKIESNWMKEGASKEVAYIKAAEWFKANRDSMPEDAEVMVDSYMRQKGEAIEDERAAKQKEAMGEAQSIFKFQGMGTVYQGLTGGPESMKILQGHYEQALSLYKDKPHLIPGVLADHYKDAFRGIVSGPGYTFARRAWENLKKAGADPDNPVNFAPGDVIVDIEGFIDGELYTYNENRGRVERVRTKNRLFTEIHKAKNVEEVNEILRRVESSEMGQHIKAEERSFVHSLGTNRIAQMTTKANAATKQIQKINYLVLRREAENGLTLEFENKLYEEAANGNITVEQAEKIYTRSDQFSMGMHSRDYKALRGDLEKIVDLEQMYYDPQNDTVGFWNMLDPEEQEAIKVAQQRTGKSPGIIKSLAVSSLLEQAEVWKDKTGNDYSQFIREFLTQQPEIKRGMLSNIGRKMWNAMQGPMPLLLVEEGPLQTGTEYDWRSSGAGVQAGVQESRTPINASGLTIEDAVATVTGLPVDDKLETKLGEYAYHSIPEGRTELYKGKDTDWLLALAMVREDRPYIDDFAMADIEMVVKAVMNTPRFGEWRNNKKNSFSVTMR